MISMRAQMYQHALTQMHQRASAPLHPQAVLLNSVRNAFADPSPYVLAGACDNASAHVLANIWARFSVVPQWFFVP